MLPPGKGLQDPGPHPHHTFSSRSGSPGRLSPPTREQTGTPPHCRISKTSWPRAVSVAPTGPHHGPPGKAQGPHVPLEAGFLLAEAPKACLTFDTLENSCSFPTPHTHGHMCCGFSLGEYSLHLRQPGRQWGQGGQIEISKPEEFPDQKAINVKTSPLNRPGQVQRSAGEVDVMLEGQPSVASWAWWGSEAGCCLLRSQRC